MLVRIRAASEDSNQGQIQPSCQPGWAAAICSHLCSRQQSYIYDLPKLVLHENRFANLVLREGQCRDTFVSGRAMHIFSTETLALHIALWSIEIGCAVNDLLQQHRLKHLVGVVLCLQLQLLVEVGEAITQWAVGVHKGAVVVLTPVWSSLVPARFEGTRRTTRMSPSHAEEETAQQPARTRQNKRATSDCLCTTLTSTPDVDRRPKQTLNHPQLTCRLSTARGDPG